METTNQVEENLIEPSSVQAVELLEGSFVRQARFCRKISRQFGWPILFLFLLGPAALKTTSKDLFAVYLAIGILPVLGGVLMRIWARGYMREEGFVLDGPYRYLRNPVELGALFAYVGAGFIAGLSAGYVLLCVFLGWIYLSFVAYAYEKDLIRRVGGPYLRYSKRVSRWLPSRLPGTNRSQRTFKLIRALRHEAESLLWLLGYLVVFAARQQLIARGFHF